MPIRLHRIWRTTQQLFLELRAHSSLPCALESLDPFNNEVARYNWRLVRNTRGW